MNMLYVWIFSLLPFHYHQHESIASITSSYPIHKYLRPQDLQPGFWCRFSKNALLCAGITKAKFIKSFWNAVHKVLTSVNLSFYAPFWQLFSGFCTPWNPLDQRQPLTNMLRDPLLNCVIFRFLSSATFLVCSRKSMIFGCSNMMHLTPSLDVSITLT